MKLLSGGGGYACPSAAGLPQGDRNGFRAPFFSRHVRDSMCNGKFRAAANDKFAAVHSNIFRVLGARGARDYLDRRAPEGDVPLPLHIHKSFEDRATNPLPHGTPSPRLSFPFFSSCVFIQGARPRIPKYGFDIRATFAIRLRVTFFVSIFWTIADNRLIQTAHPKFLTSPRRS